MFFGVQPNHCIRCTVKNCANHATQKGEDVNYCVLDRVSIGAVNENATEKEQTICSSFVPANSEK